MHPPLLPPGQNRRPHACEDPPASTYRHPRISAYCTAFSTSFLGCRGLSAMHSSLRGYHMGILAGRKGNQTRIANLLTIVNTFNACRDKRLPWGWIRFTVAFHVLWSEALGFTGSTRAPARSPQASATSSQPVSSSRFRGSSVACRSTIRSAGSRRRIPPCASRRCGCHSQARRLPASTRRTHAG